MGLKAGISSDEFSRLGGPDGAFLSKEGIIQMTVQLLPFFQHIVVKCGERGVFVAMRVSSSGQNKWLSATAAPPNPNRPIVIPSPSPSNEQLVLQWFPPHTLPKPVVNVTGAGDSLVGSLLGSLVNAQGGVFDSPESLRGAMTKAQNAAVLSLMSEFAVSPEVII